MSDDQRRPWLCKGDHGHTMGMTVRNGRGIRQLILYRQAIDESIEVGKTDIDVMGILEGQMMDIRCSVCGAIRTWEQGEESLTRLLERTQNLKNIQMEGVK